MSASADLGLDDDDNFNEMGNAALVRYEVQAGPVSVNTGITFDTGIKASKDGVGAYFGGIGLTLGPKFDISTPFGGFSVDFTKIFD